MDPSDVIQLLVLLVLLALSGIFSSMETAVTTANAVRIRTLAEEGNSRAVQLLKVWDNRPQMLSAILIANNIVNLSASSLTTTLVISLFGSAMVGVATGIITLLILVFGEISPKTLASLNADKLALSYARIIWFMMKVFTPVIFIINKLSNLFLRLLHVDPNAQPETITESELRTIVDVSHEEGVIESEERYMINNVVDFGDSLAKDIMIPRIDMVSVPVDISYDELVEVFRENMFTRMPVYEENTDNIIGIINMKDLLFIRPENGFSVRSYLRETYYTYEYKRTSELFMEMRQNYVGQAIVLDEYGATAGLITLEDLLEEIVGEIRDEYDSDELDNVIKISDYEYLVDGAMKMDDLNDQLGLNLESEDYDSVGGLIIERLDRLPREGEEVEYKQIRLVADAVDKNRIVQVHMYLPPEEEQ